MYVKVSPYGDGEELLFEIAGVAHYGKAVSTLPPSERDYADEIGAAFDFLTVHMLDDEPGDPTDGSAWWVYSYAWWWVTGDSLHGVVTSQRIFLLSSDGKTVDRVR